MFLVNQAFLKIDKKQSCWLYLSKRQRSDQPFLYKFVKNAVEEMLIHYRSLIQQLIKMLTPSFQYASGVSIFCLRWVHWRKIIGNIFEKDCIRIVDICCRLYLFSSLPFPHLCIIWKILRITFFGSFVSSITFCLSWYDRLFRNRQEKAFRFDCKFYLISASVSSNQSSFFLKPHCLCYRPIP